MVGIIEFIAIDVLHALVCVLFSLLLEVAVISIILTVFFYVKIK